jgi:hypothetical protein
MKLLTFILLLVSTACQAQSICVSVDCKDTTRYPTSVISLAGVVSSGEGIKSQKWVVLSGSATIDSPNNVSTVARGFTAGGYYVFQLTATSNKGAVGTAFDSTFYIANKPPQAVTGPTLNDTTATAVLSGSGSFDAEGLPLTYQWTQVSGPNTAAINAITMANPLVSGLINGTYLFKLTVTDQGGLTSTATQTVIVNIPVTIVKTVTTIVVYYSDGTTKTTVTTVP